VGVVDARVLAPAVGVVHARDVGAGTALGERHAHASSTKVVRM
jgi:hypothetical protein